ncbi:MAG: putative diacylglycerol acyltransferase, partial [Ilumatobacteraceae bacterium]|nr:putative diacylglycerol acyltransferase [Ilumatobacteraceae bacterium]
PYLSSAFSNVTILDRPPDMDRLLRRFERATHGFPRLRHRVQPAPANLSTPTWVDDPNFDLRFHVRHIALPKPGTMRQLLDIASLIACDPFDRTRPLWQFVIVDGLRGGKSALIQKMHHTIVDGEGGVKLSLEYLDFDRDAPDPPARRTAADDAVPEPSSLGSELVRSMVSGSLRLPLGLVRQVRDILADPTSLSHTSTAAADTVRSVLTQLGDTDKAKSPLWTERSIGRQIEVLRAPFGATRDAARRLGGTINTAFLTAAAHAAGAYHDRLGQPVEALRSSMAISTRTETSGANAFTLARFLVPTTAMPIAERFRLIQESSGSARGASAGASLDTLATVAAALPTSVITRLARQQAQTVDFATSNVRGSSMPMYCAGAQLLENHPVGPLAGVAFNLTLLSYNHSLDMGVNVDTAAVADPALLQRCLVQAFKEFAAA